MAHRNLLSYMCLAFLIVPSAVAFTTTARPRRRITARPAVSVTSAIDTFFQTQPYVSAFLTCSFKASAADLVAQQSSQQEINESIDEKTKATEDVSSVDVHRNFAFLLYGGLYQGMAQQFMYTTLFPDLFGHDGSWHTVVQQVAFDMAVVGPFLCLPIAYLVKSAVAAATNNETDFDIIDAFEKGISKYVQDVTTRGLLIKYWALWIPVQTLTFGVIPQHFRVLFVAFISFFWVCILSTVAADQRTQKVDPCAALEGSERLRRRTS